MTGWVCRVAVVATVVTLGCAREPAFEGVGDRRPTGGSAISPEGLLAAYDMETTLPDGRLRDFGPNALHGVISGTGSVEGRWGVARQFGVPADRIKLPDDPRFDQPGPLTIAVWVRVDQGGHHQHLAACDDAWALWITPDDQYRLGDTRGTGFNTAPGALRVGEWQSVVAVWAGTRGDSLTDANALLYVNGRRSDGPRGSGWHSGSLYAEDACYLGFESHQGNAVHQQLPFHGALDEVLVFSRAWTEAEVTAYSAGARH